MLGLSCSFAPSCNTLVQHSCTCQSPFPHLPYSLRSPCLPKSGVRVLTHISVAVRKGKTPYLGHCSGVSQYRMRTWALTNRQGTHAHHRLEYARAIARSHSQLNSTHARATKPMTPRRACSSLDRLSGESSACLAGWFGRAPVEGMTPVWSPRPFRQATRLLWKSSQGQPAAPPALRRCCCLPPPLVAIEPSPLRIRWPY